MKTIIKLAAAFMMCGSALSAGGLAPPITNTLQTSVDLGWSGAYGGAIMRHSEQTRSYSEDFDILEERSIYTFECLSGEEHGTRKCLTPDEHLDSSEIAALPRGDQPWKHEQLDPGPIAYTAGYGDGIWMQPDSSFVYTTGSNFVPDPVGNRAELRQGGTVTFFDVVDTVTNTWTETSTEQTAGFYTGYRIEVGYDFLIGFEGQLVKDQNAGLLTIAYDAGRFLPQFGVGSGDDGKMYQISTDFKIVEKVSVGVAASKTDHNENVDIRFGFLF